MVEVLHPRREPGRALCRPVSAPNVRTHAELQTNLLENSPYDADL